MKNPYTVEGYIKTVYCDPIAIAAQDARLAALREVQKMIAVEVSDIAGDSDIWNILGKIDAMIAKEKER